MFQALIFCSLNEWLTDKEDPKFPLNQSKTDDVSTNVRLL